MTEAPTPECAPPDREKRSWHLLSLEGRQREVEWIPKSGWWFAACSLTPSLAAKVGYHYLAPAHPPQPVDAEIVEAVKRAAMLRAHYDEAEEADKLNRAAALLRGEPDPAGGAT